MEQYYIAYKSDVLLFLNVGIVLSNRPEGYRDGSKVFSLFETNPYLTSNES